MLNRERRNLKKKKVTENIDKNKIGFKNEVKKKN